MEIETNTISKTTKWFKDISTKNEFKEAASYEGIFLLYFHRLILCWLLSSCLKNKKNNYGSAHKHFILKFMENHKSVYKSMNISRSVVRFILGNILGNILNKSTKNKQSENSNKYKILAFSYTAYWKYYPTPQKENKEVNRDATLGSVITTLQNKNFNVVALDEDSSFFIDFKTMIEKNIQGKGLCRPVEFYLTLDIIRKVLKTTEKYDEDWNKLKNNKEFIASLNHEGIQTAEFLKDYFDDFFNHKTFLPILYIELIRRAIEVEKPDLILLSCIECPFGSAAVIAGRLEGVPTIDIQHGVIHPYHFGYIQAKDEIAHDDSVTYCPISDKTAVYGHYQKELLTTMSIYPEDSIVITGSPRYDILGHAGKMYNKEKFFKNYKIYPNHKIILWATTFGVRGDNENIKDFKALFETIQNIENITLVITPHPRDGQRHIKRIKDYLNNYQISAVVAPSNSDTYEQLFVCDLLITMGSTVGMEAVALNKPVIVLDLNYNSDTIGYVKEGVALGVYKAEDLKPTIEKLLKDDSGLAKNRKKYTEKYLYKIDGKATERVVNVIEEMIKESRSDKNEKLI